ncbi:exodeoxyribonuclease III [Pseudonocardia asaccharolytica]|uniref:Exodeoxyribonuclease n=1 Tax=Pseudonocardia asaccharolytica DSM 44247 = NBRC 16224 TaxID=1123024 RepID=A0A511CUQ7_9PSEU|nr:exodeoxyribonuclease III [Pseudonocardia asaccharolytica]GEL16187.1 exodeoxyribonuclease [Pseudonocardia asaccharolytica DSM 44247 = NBRC 16224]
MIPELSATEPGRGPLTVSSVNVNGIRAAGPKGLTAWLASSTADIVCLQEVRARPEDLPAGLLATLDGLGWQLTLAPCETAPGRSGVAVLTRIEPEAVRIGMGLAEFAGSGRYLEVDLPGLTVASLYLPKGAAGTPKQDEKDRFLAGLAPYLAERRGKAAAEDREVLVCGDWNIAHTRADLRNWRGNGKNSGFLPHEREWIGSLFASGYVDVVRMLHPDVDGPYTWWSYRGRAFDNDTGWRIDYQVATPGLAARARSAAVERAPSYDRRWSDHAPVTVRYRR